LSHSGVEYFEPAGLNLFSSMINIEDGKKLTDWPTVYLVVFVNPNQTDEIDPHEYEGLILDFGK